MNPNEITVGMLKQFLNNPEFSDDMIICKTNNIFTFPIRSVAVDIS